MLFSSIPFLFYFLPCVFVLYFLINTRIWNIYDLALFIF